MKKSKQLMISAMVALLALSLAGPVMARGGQGGPLHRPVPPHRAQEEGVEAPHRVAQLRSKSAVPPLASPAVGSGTEATPAVSGCARMVVAVPLDCPA